MNWVNKHKLLAIETIKHNGQPCLELNNLWQALHSSFNIVQYCYINENVLNEIRLFVSTSWEQFLEKEFTSAIVKCNNTLAPGPNKLSWRYLKCILKNKLHLRNIIKITNTCIEVRY